jgi:hypothetical protein
MKFFRFVSRIFNDPLTIISAIIFILIVVLVIFNFVSTLPEKHPLFGVLDFAMVPILFVAGGVVFLITIWRFSK